MRTQRTLRPAPSIPLKLGGHTHTVGAYGCCGCSASESAPRRPPPWRWVERGLGSPLCGSNQGGSPSSKGERAERTNGVEVPPKGDWLKGREAWARTAEAAARGQGKGSLRGGEQQRAALSKPKREGAWRFVCQGRTPCSNSRHALPHASRSQRPLPRALLLLLPAPPSRLQVLGRLSRHGWVLARGLVRPAPVHVWGGGHWRRRPAL